jgi:hypothetical protein
MKKLILLGVFLTDCAIAAPKVVYEEVGEVTDPPPVLQTIVEGQAPASSETRHLLAQAMVAQEIRVVGKHETIPLKPADLYPYVLRVSEIHNYYMSAEGDLNSRLRKRNAEVRQLFVRFKNDRHPDVARHQVYQARDVSCKNTKRGRRKHCWDSMSWSGDYQVIPASVWNSELHFKTPAHVSASNTITWDIGVTGKGTNNGQVRGTARLTDAAIERQLRQDSDKLRERLRSQNLPDDLVIDP